MDEYPEFELTNRHQHMLNLLESHIQIQHQEFADIENKAQQYINMTAIVMAVIGAFAFSNSNYGWGEKTVLIVLVLAAAWVLVYTLKALQASEWKYLFNDDENQFSTMKEEANQESDLMYFEDMFCTHKSTIQNNHMVLNKKRRLIEIARNGLYLVIVCTGILVFLQILNA